MLSLTILTLPSSSLAISSSAGAICRHGPHHSAQKSTTTGVDDFKTSASKESSETVAVAIYLLLLGRRHSTPKVAGLTVSSETRCAPRQRQGWGFPATCGVRPNQAVLMGFP